MKKFARNSPIISNFPSREKKSNNVGVKGKEKGKNKHGCRVRVGKVVKRKCVCGRKEGKGKLDVWKSLCFAGFAKFIWRFVCVWAPKPYEQ